MRAALAVFLLLSLGCRPELTQIVVSVAGVPADTDRLAVSAQLDAQRTDLEVRPPWLFSLALPSERRGELLLDVRALNKDGCSQARAQHRVALSGGAAERVDLTLVQDPLVACVPGRICNEGFCWEAPLPQGNSLTSVYAVALDNVYAVGKRGTILRHDGKAWAQLPRSFAPSGAKAPDLYAVWASGPRDVWIAGDGILLHSGDGQTFTREDRPGTWYGLGGTGPGDVWLVGEGGALRNTGGGFASVPGLPAQRGALRAVWVGNGDEVWIVGEGGQVLHRPPGQAFRSEMLPNGSRTMSCLTVAGRGPGEAWVGGDNNTGDPMQGKGVLARFSGGAATTVLDAEIDGVLVRGNKVFAVGYRFHIGDGVGGPWTQPAVPPYKDYLAALHGPDGDHLWAVGPNGAIVTWSGGALSSEYGAADARSVWAVSEREVYRAGVDGTLRHDGSAWRPVEYERGSEGWGLSLFGLGEQVWQAGGRTDGKPIGMVWRLERGGTQEAPRHVLRPVQPPVPAAMTQGFELRALWGTSPDDLWAVGREIVDKEEKGLIAHLSGGAWKVITTDPMGQPLPQMHTVFGADGAVWAGGKRRVLLRSDNGGATWTREEIRAADLPADPMKRDTVVWNGLWGTGKGAMWGVANLECDCEAYVLQRNGDASWSVADRTLEVELNGIRGTGDRDIWVAGGAWNHALLKHYDGRWQALEVHADSALHGAWPGPAGLFIGGPYNLLRRSR